jgi:hypothetical protein
MAKAKPRPLPPSNWYGVDVMNIAMEIEYTALVQGNHFDRMLELLAALQQSAKDFKKALIRDQRRRADRRCCWYCGQACGKQAIPAVVDDPLRDDGMERPRGHTAALGSHARFGVGRCWNIGLPTSCDRTPQSSVASRNSEK